MSCPHCKFMEELFSDDKIENNREYWIMTEVFVYLHHGKDYCDWIDEAGSIEETLANAIKSLESIIDNPDEAIQVQPSIRVIPPGMSLKDVDRTDQLVLDMMVKISNKKQSQP